MIHQDQQLMNDYSRRLTIAQNARREQRRVGLRKEREREKNKKHTGHSCSTPLRTSYNLKMRDS